MMEDQTERALWQTPAKTRTLQGSLLDADVVTVSVPSRMTRTNQ